MRHRMLMIYTNILKQTGSSQGGQRIRYMTKIKREKCFWLKRWRTFCYNWRISNRNWACGYTYLIFSSFWVVLSGGYMNSRHSFFQLHRCQSWNIVSDVTVYKNQNARIRVFICTLWQCGAFLDLDSLKYLFKIISLVEFLQKWFFWPYGPFSHTN